MAISPYDLDFGAQNPTAAYMQQNQAQPMNGINPLGGVPQTMSSPLGLNMGTANLVLGGIGTIGNLWAAFNAQKMAKKQFEYTKGITDTNLANQIQSYNTALKDRIAARSVMQGDSQATTDAYIQENMLRDRRVA